MSLAERMRQLENRVYAALRHPSAVEAGRVPAGNLALAEAFGGASYCLVVSYRRDGTPIATPVWFALDGKRLVFESDADSLKVRRIRRDGCVRVAPCNSRGRPLAAPVEGAARILEPGEEAGAELALSAKYGRTRGAVMRARPSPEAGRSYVEVTKRTT